MTEVHMLFPLKCCFSVTEDVKDTEIMLFTKLCGFLLQYTITNMTIYFFKE